MLTWDQIAVFGLFISTTIILANFGGRHRKNYKRVVVSGYLLIVEGCSFATALQWLAKSEASSALLAGFVNFVLVLAASIGASFIAHAKMNMDPEDTWWL